MHMHNANWSTCHDLPHMRMHVHKYPTPVSTVCAVQVSCTAFR
jgi:hypothetical protein